MPTTYTDIFRGPLMTPGDPSVRNSWGVACNAWFQMLEQGASGRSVVDLTGMSAHTLTTANNAPDEARPIALFFTGTPAANCPVTIPPRSRVGLAVDLTSGGRTITLTTGTGTVTTLVPGLSVFYQCDGINVIEVPAHVGTLPTLTITGALTVGSINASGNITSAGTLTVASISTTSGIAIGGAISATSVTATGAGSFASIQTSGPVRANGTIGTNVAGSGNVVLNPGDTTNNGFIAFYNPAGTRMGYVGYGTTTLSIQADSPGGVKNAWNINGSAVTIGDQLFVNGRINGSTDIVINSQGNAGGIYYSNFNSFEWHSYVENSSADKITQYRSGWYDRWESATGARRWAAPSGYIMTLDGGGGLTVNGFTSNGTITAAGQTNSDSYQCRSGTFYVASTSNYYMQRNSGDGSWYWVDNGNVIMRLFAYGELNVPSAIRSTGGGDITTGGNMGCNTLFGQVSTGGSVTAGSIHSTGNIAADGNVTAGANMSCGTIFAQVSTGGTVQGGFLHSTGNVQADNDLNANNNVNCQHCTANAGGAAFNAPNGSGVSAGGWFPPSDRRWKRDLKPISAEEAVSRVRAQNPYRYVVDVGEEERHQAGIIAQDEIAAGRGEFVLWTPTDDPRAAEGDEHSKPGMRAFYDYNSEIAFLTRALQDALARIEHLERLVSDPR